MIIRVPLPSLQNTGSGGNFDIDDEYISNKVTEFKPSILQQSTDETVQNVALRDWTFSDAFKEGIRDILLPESTLMEDYQTQSLIGSSPEEFARKANREQQLYRAFSPDFRDQLLKEDIDYNTRNRKALEAVADYVAPVTPHKEPEGFWENVGYHGTRAIPNVLINLAELSMLMKGGPNVNINNSWKMGELAKLGTNVLPKAGTNISKLALYTTAKTIDENQKTREQIYANLRRQGKSHEEAYEIANNFGANVADSLLRGATNAVTMYLLGKTPNLNTQAGMSPIAQTITNIAGAAGVSGTGSAAEQALTNYRSNIENDPLELAKTGAIAGGTTAALGTLNAARNWRNIKNMQDIYKANQPIDVDFRDLPPDEGTEPQPPVEPNTPNAPSGSNFPVPFNDPLAPASPISNPANTAPNNGAVIFMPPNVNEYSQNLDNIKSGIYEDIKTGRIDPMEGYNNLIKFDGISQNEARDLVVKATKDKAIHKNDVQPQQQSINPELEKNINARDDFYKKLYEQQQKDREALKQQRQQEQDRRNQLADYYLETDPELIDTVEKINNASPIQLKEYTKKLYPNLNPSELEGITKQDLRSALKFRITEKIRKEEERLKQIQKQKEEEAKQAKLSPKTKDPLTSFLDVVKQQPSTPQEPVQPPVPTVDTPPAPSSHMWQDPLKSNTEPKQAEPVVSPLGEQPTAPVKETVPSVKPQLPVVNQSVIDTAPKGSVITPLGEQQNNYPEYINTDPIQLPKGVSWKKDGISDKQGRTTVTLLDNEQDILGQISNRKHNEYFTIKDYADKTANEVIADLYEHDILSDIQDKFGTDDVQSLPSHIEGDILSFYKNKGLPFSSGRIGRDLGTNSSTDDTKPPATNSNKEPVISTPLGIAPTAPSDKQSEPVKEKKAIEEPDTVAVYNPNTDEFVINPKYGKIGWVRNIEDAVRNNLKPSKQIIEAAQRGELSDGMYDTFGLDKPTQKTTVPEKKEQEPLPGLIYTTYDLRNGTKTVETKPLIPLGEQSKPLTEGGQSIKEVAEKGQKNKKNEKGETTPALINTEFHGSTNWGNSLDSKERERANEENIEKLISCDTTLEMETLLKTLNIPSLQNLAINFPQSKHFSSKTTKAEYIKNIIQGILWEKKERAKDPDFRKHVREKTVILAGVANGFIPSREDFEKISDFIPNEQKKYLEELISQKEAQQKTNAIATQQTEANIPIEGVFKAPQHMGIKDLNTGEIKYEDWGEHDTYFKRDDKNPNIINFFTLPPSVYKKGAKPVAYRDEKGEYHINNPELDAKELEEAFNKYLQKGNGEKAVDTTPQQLAHSTDDKSPSQKIADTIGDNLSHIIKGDGQGKKLNNKAFFDISDKAFGGTQGEGKYTPKDAYDAMEMGVNQSLLKSGITAQSEPHGKNLTILSNIVNSLPTQANRTEDQIEFQQFSTPPTLAYIANWLANINKGDTVLEPSAGLGGLAVFAKNAGANLILNELDPRRARLLESMKLGKVYRENAEYIGNILLSKLGENERPDKVVMNPPFSSTAGRIKGQRDSSNAIKHVEQALQLMKNGGRLVAILGKGTTSKPTWKDIESKYNVRAAIDIDGSNYSKYGTSYDNMIVVIDKDGVTPEGGTVTGNFKSLIDIVNSLGTVRDSVPQTKKAEPKIEATSQADTSTKAEPVEEVKTTPPQIDDIPLEQKLTDDFKKAFDKHDNGRVFVRIPDLREELGWEHDMFDDVVKYLRDNKIIQLHTGDVSVDPRIAKDGFIDDNGFRFGTITWNGNDTKVTPPHQSNDKPTGAAEKPKTERKAKETASEPEPKRQETKTAQVKKRSINEILENPTPYKIVKKTNEETEKERKSAIETEKEKNNNSVYMRYVPSIKSGVAHPGKVDESISLANTPLPKLTYNPDLPAEIIEDGDISNAQLETVAYAGQAFTKKLNNGSTQGYFLADNTGMGKGRTISAIIHDALAHGYGNGKAVWISADAKKDGLFKEAQGHWGDIGNDPNDIFSQLQIKVKDDIKRDNGILFSAYSLIRQKKKNSSDFERLEQINKWLGEDFDGIIVFDECHKGNNATTTPKKFGKSKPSETSEAMKLLQDKFPKAKMLYSSATGATELRNLAAYPRLGLWGNENFENREDFLFAMGEGGLSAMEVIIRSLKAMGLYSSRSLSLEGVTYSQLDVNLNEGQRAIYNEIAKGWRKVQEGISQAAKLCGSPDGKADWRIYGTFYGARQRAFNMAITYLKVPALIKDIEKQLEKGNSIVIQLTNTNEQKKQGTKKDDSNTEIEDDEDASFNISPMTSLINFIKEKYPIYQIEEYKDDEGNIRQREAKDSEGNKITVKNAVLFRDNLIANLKSIPIQNPLDMIIEYFGEDKVVEVTGRSTRVVNGKKQNWGKDKGMADKQNFDNGKKRILIFSEAGGTGISYHAGRQFENQQKRIHYLLQPGWRADIAMQGLGRTHRTNQAQPPHYVLVATDIPGEKRFTSSIARRLLQLGALTSGERKSTTQGMFSERDNLESEQAEQALLDLIANLDDEAKYDILDTIGLKRNEEGKLKKEDISFSKVFNGMLALDVNEQRMVWGKFDRFLETEIKEAIRKGTLDLGTQNKKADSIKLLETKPIPHREGENIDAQYRVFELQSKVKYRTWDKLNMKVSRINEQGEKVYKNIKISDYKFYTNEDGEIFAARPIEGAASTNFTTGALEPKYILYSIRENKRLEKNLAVLEGRVFNGKKSNEYTEIKDVDEAKKLWEKQIKESPVTMPEKLHLVTGTLLQIWKKLPQGTPKIWRVIADNGEEYLGRELPQKELKASLRNLGFKDTADVEYTPKELRKLLSLRGTEATATTPYDGNITLKVSRVNGENRIEIIAPYYIANKYNAFAEWINNERRFFIPNNDDDILQTFIKDYPTLEVKEKGWGDYESEGIDEINSEIPDENAENLYFIPPSVRNLFNWGNDNPDDETLPNGVEEYTPKNYQSEDPDIQERIDEAHEQKRSVNGLFNLFSELGKDIYQSMGDIPALKGKEKTFGKAMEAIKELRRVRLATIDELKNSFRIILHDLTPDDYSLFEAYMRVADLKETLGRDENALLPYGYTPDTLETDYEKFSRELEKNEKVKKAVNKAEAYGEQIRKDLFNEADKLGFYDLRDKLSRKHYFRHLVLSFYTVKNGGEITSSSIKRVLKGGVYRRREGSELDISSNWVQAMGEAYTRIADDTKVLKMLSKIRDEYDIIETCKEHAMQMNLEHALKKIKGDLKGINAEDKLKEELFSSQSKAVSKIFELANNGDLPVGLNKEWGELVHKLTEAGQLENLDEKTKDDFARYIGWLINNDVTDAVKPNTKAATTAQRMAKRIIYSEASKRRTLKKINGDEYVKWTDLIPLDYDIFIPTDSGLVSTANTLPDNIINIAMDNLSELVGVPLKDIAQSLQTGGNKQMWVLHKDLIKALNDLGKKKEQSAFGKIARKIMKGERLWALFAPVKGRVIKYNIGNFLGDFEAVLQGNPHAIKYVRRATKELAGYFYKGNIPEKDSDLEDFIKRGGASISQSSTDLIDNWDKMADFQHLLNKKEKTSLLKMPVKFINGYFEVMKHFSNYREAILRYAAYLSFKQLIEDNGGKAPFYAMSKPELVDLLEGDTPAMAFKLSNEMLGAYDEISSFTRGMLDNNILMFGAYQEVNITRSWQMYKNAWRGNSYFNYYIEKHGQKIIDNLIAGGGGGDKKPPEPPSGNGADWDDDGIGDWDDDRAWWQRWLEKLSRTRDPKILREGLSRLAAISPILALSALSVLSIMAPLTYVARFFNWLNPNEKELPEEIQKSSHLTLWKNPFNGRIYYISNVGSAFVDYWTIDPQTIIFRGVKDILNGKQTFGGLVSDLASALPNRILQNTNPVLKTILEGLFGKSTYPDFRNGREISDFPRYVAQSQNLEWWYDWLMGNPLKPFDAGELFASSQPTDGSGQYWNIKSKVKEFQKKVLHTTSGFYGNERSKYIRQAITALNYGYDKKQIDKYFRDYARESYITGIKDPVKAWNRSIKNLDPLNGLNERQKAQFWKWLSEEERKDFQKAKKYFKFLEARLSRME